MILKTRLNGEKMASAAPRASEGSVVVFGPRGCLTGARAGIAKEPALTAEGTKNKALKRQLKKLILVREMMGKNPLIAYLLCGFPGSREHTG
jgi:hypothetical protein